MKSRTLLIVTLAALAAASCAEKQPKILTDVPEQGYFKDIFIDSGIQIAEHEYTPAVRNLGLSHETLRLGDETPDNLAIQEMIFCGSEEDLNGRLLYPDGAPRFKCIYVYGGLATYHGNSLGETGRDRFRAFYDNGGSYVGSCAGAYLCCKGFDVTHLPKGYLGIWPDTCDEAAIEDIFPTYELPEDSPLLRYDDFGGDRMVDSVEHCNGPFFSRWEAVPGTEVLACNRLEGSVLDGNPSLIAFKRSEESGRLILSGGHPELPEGGEQLDLMSAILSYAIDGRGSARLKAMLDNGETREMTSSTADGDPGHAMIGDLQYHHFAFFLPKKARNVRVRLESLSGHNLSLRMSEGAFAFRDEAACSVENEEPVKELVFDRLPAGTWYIGIQCEETVKVTDERCYDIYEGAEVLNGVPYTVSVTWDAR